MASAASIKAGSAYVELLLNDSRFIKGLNRAAARLRAFGASIQGLGTRLAAGSGAVLSALSGSAVAFSQMGDSLAKMAARTGISVEAVSELAFAAELSGTNVATLEGSIRRMQKSLVEAGNGSAAVRDALVELNLTINDLQGRSPDEQFKLIADRLSQVQSPALRAALAMKLFGKAGTQLLPLMQEGAAGIEALQEQARALGLTMSTEDAQAAEQLNDTLDILFNVLKRTVFVIGSALAPAMRSAAETVTAVIVTVNDWIGRNRALVVSALKITVAVFATAAALIGFGLAASALGTALGALTTIAGAVGTVVATLGTALAAILSPIGLIIAATVALGAYLLYSIGVGAEAMAWLGARFSELKDFAVEAFGGIADALAAGDISLAAQILWLSLRVAWERGTAVLQSLWLRFRSFFIQTAHDAFYSALAAWKIVQHGLSVAWIETTAFMSRVWTSFTSGFQQAWNEAINWTTKRLLDLAGLLDSSLDVDAAKNLADQELASTNAQIESQQQSALAQREQQRAAERKQAKSDHDSALARIGQESIDKERALQDEHAARVKDAEGELARARAELADAIKQAHEKRQQKDAAITARANLPPEIEDLLAGIGPALAAARDRTIGVAGSFNAFEARGLGAGGVTDRIAKSSEETAKNTKKLIEEIRDLEGAEFE